NNIPLPTWRPDRSLPADLAAQDKSVLLALADTAQHNKTATDAFSVLPSARPDEAKADEVKPDEVKAVLDEANATSEASVASGEYQVSSLEPRSAFNDPSGVDAASPRDAIAS
ncbi:peptidase M15, partial [Mesorhizobium sp. M8A.F.Ca.ET.213.01.1.1]